MKRTKIKPVGKRRTERSARIKRSYPIVERRAGGACEACGYRSDALQLAHLFGRDYLGAWADEPAFAMMLCADDPRSGRHGCHQDIDQHRDPLLRDRLEWRAVVLFAEQNGLEDHLLDMRARESTARLCALTLTRILEPA